MGILIIRVVFVVLCSIIGYFFAPFGLANLVGLAFGFILSLIVIALDIKVRKLPAKVLTGSLIGFLVGIALASLINSILGGMEFSFAEDYFLKLLLLGGLGYLGLMVGAKKGEWLDLKNIKAAFKERGVIERYKVLDTSVIIDGRIADVCETGFIDGSLVVPQFILRELQRVADSSDSLKRNRGRRGLDILQKIKKQPNINVQISELDFPDIKEVDLKLLEVCRYLGGKIITNDFNLNKIAQLRGIEVLNINELANALKPVVLPGEMMSVFIIKEGKEPTQGVAYLDDGTMVVVDNARKSIGKTIKMVVTSVLQTTAGKMIFGKFEPEPAEVPRES